MARRWGAIALATLAIGGCESLSVPIPFLSPDALCSAKGVTVDADFPAGGQHSCVIGADGGIVVQVDHETTLVEGINPSPWYALRLTSDAARTVTLTLDYTHFTRIGLPDSAVEPLLKCASHFHVRGARKGRLQAAFSDNVIDYQRVYQRMKSLRYRGWIGIEYVWIDWEHCNEVDNLSETVLLRDHILNHSKTA